jgi:SulP family sulfate permease
MIAQGLANIASALFGGISVTGTIARTATNVRAGARTPIAGMLHSAFLLLFLVLAARLASYVPLAALAGVLVVVAWNMADQKEIGDLLRHVPGTAIFGTTFIVTLLKDLTFGIVCGCLVALVFALIRRWGPGQQAGSRPAP